MTFLSPSSSTDALNVKFLIPSSDSRKRPLVLWCSTTLAAFPINNWVLGPNMNLSHSFLEILQSPQGSESFAKNRGISLLSWSLPYEGNPKYIIISRSSGRPYQGIDESLDVFSLLVSSVQIPRPTLQQRWLHCFGLANITRSRSTNQGLASFRNCIGDEATSISCSTSKDRFNLFYIGVMKSTDT